MTHPLRTRSVCSSLDSGGRDRGRARPSGSAEPSLLKLEGRIVPMADVTIELLKTHFRQLRLPTMGQEFEKLAEMPSRPIRRSSSSYSG